MLLVVLAAGIIEFGRAFMVAHMVMHAAREGARFAATLPGSYRDDSGCYTEAGRTFATSHVQEIIQGTLDVHGDFGEVDIEQSLDGAVPMVTVRITGSIDYVMLPGLLGNALDVDRTIVFRDEGRDDGRTC